jgi:hypothetical protein
MQQWQMHEDANQRRHEHANQPDEQNAAKAGQIAFGGIAVRARVTAAVVAAAFSTTSPNPSWASLSTA